jgi:hypothetical protein
MADLKPLGSEKLNGDDKLKRILELAYYKTDNKKNTPKAEIVKESKTGGVYGVVKEKDGYYVKRGLNENSLDYIGGMFMKNKNKFSSYAEAFKRLELIKGQEEYLNEATKYVLKTDKPAQEEAPVPMPAIDDAPPADAGLPPMPPEEGGESPAGEEPLPELPPMEGGDDMGGEGEEAPSESKRSDYMAEAQKHAGRLGQELRDIKDKMESDDIKYILNMIISAVDLDKLDDEDIEDIAEKFERDEEQGAEEGGEDNLGGEELGGEELPAEEPVAADEELGEEANPMDALESFINSSIDEEYTDFDEEDLSGLGEEEEMYELNIGDYADLDEEAIDDSMFDFKPDYVSPSLGGDDDVELDESNDLIGKFGGQSSWTRHDNSTYDGNFDDYSDDETFDDYDTFNSKYQGKHKWFGDKGHSTFRMYKDKYGPFSVRNRKPKEMDSEVEIDLEEIKKEINNNIHTTLSKYFK